MGVWCIGIIRMRGGRLRLLFHSWVLLVLHHCLSLATSFFSFIPWDSCLLSLSFLALYCIWKCQHFASICIEFHRIYQLLHLHIYTSSCLSFLRPMISPNSPGKGNPSHLYPSFLVTPRMPDPRTKTLCKSPKSPIAAYSRALVANAAEISNHLFLRIMISNLFSLFFC